MMAWWVSLLSEIYSTQMQAPSQGICATAGSNSIFRMLYCTHPTPRHYFVYRKWKLTFTTCIVLRPSAVAASPKKDVNVAPNAATVARTARPKEALRRGKEGDEGEIHIEEHQHAVVISKR